MSIEPQFTETNATQEFINNLPGIQLIPQTEQKHLHDLTEELGTEIIQQVWDLYGETGLVDAEGNMWGDKDESGMSKGPIPHSIVVAKAALILSKELDLNIEDALILAVTGLTHDAYKRVEIETKNPNESHARSYDHIAKLFGTEVAKLSTLSGHTAMPAVLENFDDIRALIIFWVDNVVVGRNLTTVDAKCDYLDKMAATRYAYNDDGILIYGKPYFTFQRQLATVIEARLVKIAQASGKFEGIRLDKLSEELQRMLAE